MGNFVVEMADVEDHPLLPYNVVELYHYEDVLFVDAVESQLMDFQIGTVVGKTVAVETEMVEHAAALVDP